MGVDMFTEKSSKQNKVEMVMLEDLVPQDHLLRRIDKRIDFSFLTGYASPIIAKITEDRQ